MHKTKNSLPLATAGLATVAALSGIGGAVGTATAQEDIDQDFSHAAASNQAEYDLEPYFQTSGAKAKGFAGTVVLKVKNVGSQRYYQDYPLTTFLICKVGMTVTVRVPQR